MRLLRQWSVLILNITVFHVHTPVEGILVRELNQDVHAVSVLNSLFLEGKKFLVVEVNLIHADSDQWHGIY